MNKTKPHSIRTSSFYRDKFWFIAGSIFVLILFCVIWSFGESFSDFSNLLPTDCSSAAAADRSNLVDREYDPQETTFYDDPEITYTLDNPMKDWDSKRKEWLRLHPTFIAGVENRTLILTGSQPLPCKFPSGDHLLLRTFKNKVDYARIHGHDFFYANSLFNLEMKTYWSKIPLVRAAMLAHPEAEWIMWVDSDAIFTDMDFKVPLERYKHHNFVVHGWPDMIYEKKSWVAVNAGIFLIRNCQWSMEFLDVWGSMGPQTLNYERAGQILRTTLTDKMFPESDDQSTLVYLLLKEPEKWGKMMYVENEYYLHGFWVEAMAKLDNVTTRYEEIEKKTVSLTRRHAELVSESYGKMWEEHLKGSGDRRPFITHFTGCQPCSGKSNAAYKGDDCWVGMDKALNFADNQVLRSYGFWHPDLRSGSISPLPFDFPGDDNEPEGLV